MIPNIEPSEKTGDECSDGPCSEQSVCEEHDPFESIPVQGGFLAFAVEPIVDVYTFVVGIVLAGHASHRVRERIATSTAFDQAAFVGLVEADTG